MVRGLDIFKKHFGKFADNYIIIGGTACDLIIEEAGLTPRVTKDIDMILVVEVFGRTRNYASTWEIFSNWLLCFTSKIFTNLPGV